jgi:predicted GIY-YIG superfamily endonuclease
MSNLIDLGKYALIPLKELELKRRKLRSDGKRWNYYVYGILTSTGKYYIGYSGDIRGRLKDHITRPTGYMKRHRFRKLIHLEHADSHLDAMLREQELWALVAKGKFKPQEDLTVCKKLQDFIIENIKRAQGDTKCLNQLLRKT